SVVPAGAEPHDFEPTSKDIAGIYAADLFVYNGGGFDAWAEKLRPEVEKAGVTVINLTETLLLETSGLRYENGGVDPHFWLDPSRAKEAITVIGETLKHLDPDGRPHYNAFVERAAARLDLLDRNYQETLGQCALSEIIVSHDAFRYLGHRYGFRTIAIAGFSPEEEPSLAQIAKLVELARAKGIRHIFFESLVSPKLSETIAREIGGSVLSLNPIEGLTDEGLHAGDDYVSLMRENLINLAAGLQCT
ncbi:MAG: zinc ABC transporter substrate-binding protein, partial [Deltaproteobacteria bacterium]|nr:zinc ABC transporter substrate-binding protein [Deltaproteobacteria bacterium]